MVMMSVFSAVANAEAVYKCVTNGRDAKYQNSPCDESKQIAATVFDMPVTARKQITLKQNNGHYLIAGEINRTKLTFLIDTGASTIAIPQLFANQAHIICTNQFVTMNTANGKVQACVTTVPKLTLSPFEFNNVEVYIHPNLETPLLGMTILQKFNIEQRNGEMHISEH